MATSSSSSSSTLLKHSSSPALPPGAAPSSSSLLQQQHNNGARQHQHLSRPSLHDHRAITTGTMNLNAGNAGIDSPVAANSIANRTANAAYGLYQNCLSLRRQLRRVPGFAAAFLDNVNDGAGNENAGSDYPPASSDATSPLSPTGTGPPTSATIDATAHANANANDPVSQVCRTLRLGSSLCYIWNTLGQGKPLEVNPDASPTNFKACQRAAAHFVMACNTQLGWNDDDIFRITELYSPDTNGTVKVSIELHISGSGTERQEKRTYQTELIKIHPLPLFTGHSYSHKIPALTGRAWSAPARRAGNPRCIDLLRDWPRRPLASGQRDPRQRAQIRTGPRSPARLPEEASRRRHPIARYDTQPLPEPECHRGLCEKVPHWGGSECFPSSRAATLRFALSRDGGSSCRSASALR